MYITQETFDDVVKENMEDFDMDREAAVRDAVDQFRKQGADLSLVDTAADGVGHNTLAKIVAHVEALRGLEVNAQGRLEGEAESRCMALLSELGEFCREDDEAGDRHKTALGKAGGIAAISRFMEQDEENETDLDCSSHEVVVTCMSTLKDACRNHEQNRDAFIYKNMAQVTKVLLRTMDRRGNKYARDVVESGLRLVRVVCTKTENNKVCFMRHGGTTVLTETLRRYGSGNDKNAGVTKEACGALRSVTLRDDRRKDLSGAYNSVKTLVSKGAVPLLLDTARSFKADASTLSWVFLALKQLAANDETVKMIAQESGLTIVRGAIADFPLEVVICRTSLSLFRNVCANDTLKTKLLNDGGLELILGCMSHHKDDKALQEHGCATLGAMALRSPSSGARIVGEGGITAVVEAMRRHASAQFLQRHACLCIRNIAARGPSLRQTLLDEGCESVLREAGKLRGCVDEAYMALRDLRCEVGLVTLGEGGEVQVGVAAFGEQKPNFNPTQNETSDLAERVEGSATAPKHAGYRL